MDINNFVIDRVLSGTMFSRSTQKMLWRLTQITNPSLNCTAESVDAVDAIGTPIMTLFRAKTAEFSGENALFDLGLAGAQMGAEKVTATSEAKITMPMFEEFEVTAETKDVSLKFAPIGTIPFIYAINKNSSLGTTYKKGSEANATDFVHTDKEKSITLPTGLAVGTIIQVYYEYESETGSMIENRGDKFPVAGKFVLDVIGYDVCDQEQMVHCYITLPNAKLTSDVDMTFTTEGTHSFTIKALQDYCDTNKRLFTISVVDM